MSADVVVRVAGADVRARLAGAKWKETRGPAANRGQISFDAAVTEGQLVEVALVSESPERILFSGEILDVAQTYDLDNSNSRWDAGIIDRSYRANRRRPFGTFTNDSASDVALALAAFAPDCTTTGIQVSPALPEISIVFDGSQPLMTCFQRVAAAVAGDCQSSINYGNDLALYQTDPYAPADPLDDDHRPLNDPAVQFTADLAQVFTRVYGKGYTGTLQADVLAGETILPLSAADIVLFNPLGGQAIAGTAAGAAQSEIFAYTGVQLGGGGTLVGPGAAPPAAPILALAAGTGLGSGVYQYAYTDVTAAGESLPSPIGSITTGYTAVPVTAPTPAAATTGGSVDFGSHDYQITFVTSSGETSPSPTSAAVSATNLQVTDPSVAPSVSDSFSADTSWSGFTWAFKYAYSTKTSTTDFTSMTAVSPASGSFTDSAHSPLLAIPYSTDPAVKTILVFYGLASGSGGFHGAGSGALSFSNNSAGGTLNAVLNGSGVSFDPLKDPTSNTTPAVARQTIALSAIQIGGAEVTSRKLYRRFNGSGTFKLVTTIANNSATTYSDTTANSGLGADAPSSNTATAQQTSISGIAVGASTVTSRKVYRTAVGASQLKLLHTIADNTTTTYADSTADGSLGANAPTSDTSGLTQPSGQVNAGSTTLLTASAAPFSSTGGWVLLSNGQAARYTGISGNTLTGIPASGTGSLLTTVIYGQQALPAPALVGVQQGSPPGVTLAMGKGSTVAIWVQRDDLAAQTALGLLELDEDGVATDGIREDTLFDGRLGEDALIAACDARLDVVSRVTVGVTYGTLNPTQARCGATIAVDLSGAPGDGGFDPLVFDPRVFDEDWGIAANYVIQTADIGFYGPKLRPRYVVTAASAQPFTLSDFQRLAAISG